MIAKFHIENSRMLPTWVTVGSPKDAFNFYTSPDVVDFGVYQKVTLRSFLEQCSFGNPIYIEMLHSDPTSWRPIWEMIAPIKEILPSGSYYAKILDLEAQEGRGVALSATNSMVAVDHDIEQNIYIAERLLNAVRICGSKNGSKTLMNSIKTGLMSFQDIKDNFETLKERIPQPKTTTIESALEIAEIYEQIKKETWKSLYREQIQDLLS